MKGYALAIAIVSLVPFTPALAEPGASDQVSEIRASIESLRGEQAQRIAAIQQETDARIRALEERLSLIEGRATGSPSPAAAAQVNLTAAPPPPVAAAASAGSPSRLQLSGDLRLRYEANFGDSDARNRDRGTVRARLRASYAATDWLTVGGQIATGDPDDPNSTDVTLSSFDDDLNVSLDQAYALMNLGDLQLVGGKIPQPFTRTELVWDGDVSPQGLGAAYKLPLPGGGAVKATGFYFLVDESVAGPDSRMIGGQLALASSSSATWQYELAAAYYDYALRSIAGADGGDFRSNLRAADGRYLSDFNLFDVIASVTYKGFGERWPVRFVGDYVRNFGAATNADTGYSVDLILGRATKQGDWRFGYGYAAAETDAVLAAFSQDNTNIATNYLQHSLVVDYVLRPKLMLNATFYRYRPYHTLDAGPNDPRDWLNRLRLAFMISF